MTASCALASVALASLNAAAALLPANRGEWADALRAEIASVDSDGARARLGFGGAVALARIAAREGFAGNLADGRVVGVAVLLGLLATSIDLAAPSRTPALVLVLGASLVLGVARPAAAWRWGILLAGILPLVCVVGGFPAPYAHDRGDIWFLLVPSVVLGTAGSQLRRRLTRS